MIILFGMAGSGKSSQGKALAEIFGWKWLSVGQVIRDTGKYDAITKTGELVDNGVVIGLMDKQIQKAEADGMNVILDGYPRDIEQGEWMMQNIAQKIEAAIVIDVPEEELWRRIEVRGRADDTREALRTRFNIYEQNIYTILEMFKNAGIIIEEIDGVGSFDEVTGRLVRKIEAIVDGATEQFTDVNGGEIERSYGE